VLLDLPDERCIVECPCGEILVAKPRIVGRELRAIDPDKTRPRLVK
jgi:hypothetical protein